MDKRRKLAEVICTIGRNRSIDIDTIGIITPTINWAYHAEEGIDCWDCQAFKAWLAKEETPQGRRLYAPYVEEVVIIDDDSCNFVVRMERLIGSTEEDYERYAHWAGYDTYEEAQCYYGDMPCSFDRFSVLVNGYDAEKFLRLIAPYCWG